MTDAEIYVSALLDTTSAYTLSIDLSYAFGEGGDEGIAMAEFNGFAVFFGSNNTVLYENPENPVAADPAFRKVETIIGVGCLHRDSIQNVGKDLLFLSNIGMRTLSRVIQEKSNPVTDIAPQVRDFVLDQANSSSDISIKSAFVATLGLYFLTMTKTTLVFDTRRPLASGALRVVEWDQGLNAPGYDGDNGLMICRAGVVYEYKGALDGEDSAGNGVASFDGDYEGGWLDFGQIADGAGTLVKYLKKLHMTYVGGNGATVTFKWTTDYEAKTSGISFAVPDQSASSFFGGTANFGGGSTLGTTVKIGETTKSISRSGRVIKIGFIIQNSTVQFSVNRIDIFAKVGKLQHN